jgi:hypothetical protein
MVAKKGISPGRGKKIEPENSLKLLYILCKQVSCITSRYGFFPSGSHLAMHHLHKQATFGIIGTTYCYAYDFLCMIRTSMHSYIHVTKHSKPTRPIVVHRPDAKMEGARGTEHLEGEAT